MPIDAGKYNFRYVAERQRFYQNLKSILAHVYEAEGMEVFSASQVVFEIGPHSSYERKVQARGRRKNWFQGLHTFKDIRRLQRFLNTTGQMPTPTIFGNYEDMDRLEETGQVMSAKIAYYPIDKNRITHEKTIANFKIEMEKLPAEERPLPTRKAKIKKRKAKIKKRKIRRKLKRRKKRR